MKKSVPGGPLACAPHGPIPQEYILKLSTRSTNLPAHPDSSNQSRFLNFIAIGQILFEVVELYVVMHCEACAAAVRRAIRKIPGVESYKLDFYGQKVTVIGKVDREDVWRRIHKTGKRVILIPKPAPPKKEEKKEIKKEENKEEKKDAKAEEKEEKTEEKKETKVADKEETILVRKKSMYWPAVRLWRFLIPHEVKVHEKEEVVTLVKTKEEKKDDVKGEEKAEGKEEKKEKIEKVKEPEWVPLLVTAPFYTLPTSIY